MKHVSAHWGGTGRRSRPEAETARFCCKIFERAAGTERTASPVLVVQQRAIA